MSSIKTAISLDASLFEEVTKLAEEQEQTRSGLIAQAIREYLDRCRNRRFYEQMCAAHCGGQDDEERAFVDFSKRQLRQVADQS